MDTDRVTRNLGVWMGVLSALVTVLLTIGNFWTKTKIDQTETSLKALEAGLHERAQGVEESKERVARYTWVRGLFPDLDSSEPRKKTLTLVLIRLALNKDEAEQFFGALASSSDQSLQQAGQKGLDSLQDEARNDLVIRLKSDNAEVRKGATQLLIQQYHGSPTTISSVLNMFDDQSFPGLSPSAVIDALVYLSNTDPIAWNKDQVKRARQAIAKVESRGVGTQTQDAIHTLEAILMTVESQH
jgi:hypothetical protein